MPKNWAVLWVGLKEFRCTARDPHVLVYLAFPFILTPVILWGISQLSVLEAGRLERNPPRVAVVGPADLRAAITSDQFQMVEALPQDIEQANAEVLVEGVSNKGLLEVTIHHSSTRPDSRRAVIPIREALNSLRQERWNTLIQKRGLDAALIQPLEIVEIAVGPADRLLPRLFAFLVAVMALTCLVMGAYYPTLNVMVTEREKNTLETSRSLPVSISTQLVGKWLACSGWALGFALTTVAAVTLTMAHLQGMFLEQPVQISISAIQLIAAAVGLTAAAGFVAAGGMIAMVPARNFKEGELLATLFLIPMVALAGLGAYGLIEGDRSWCFLPLASTTTLVGDALAGELTMRDAAWSILSHFGLTAGLLAANAWLVARDDYVTGQLTLRQLLRWRRS